MNGSRLPRGGVASALRAVLGFAVLLLVLAGCATSDRGMLRIGGDAAGTTRYFAMLRDQAPLEGVAAMRGFQAQNQYVVSTLQRQAAATQGPLIAMLEQRGVKYKPYWIANMVWVESDDKTRKEVAARPEVESIEPDGVITLDDPEVPELASDRVTPDATVTAEQNVSRVHAPDVWTYNGSSGYTGNGVTVGVIDTGVYAGHTAFGGRAKWGTNTVDRQDSDGNGHGTHVAGTIIGSGGIGVAPDAKVISCKALNASGSGTWSTVASCMEWMTSHAVRVVNMSLGGGFSDSLSLPIKNMFNAGILPVAAAGNDGACGRLGSPAGFGEVVAVGALTEDATANKMSTYSSGGPADKLKTNKPDVVAQGSLVRSAWIGSTTAYKTISWTSMASPAVAGVAALVLSARPDLNPTDLAQILKRTANGNVTGAKCAAPNSFGTGLVDAKKAVEEAIKLPVRAQ